MIFDPNVPLHWKDVIGPTGVILTLVAGILQYRQTTRRDFIKPLRETQLRAYEQATSAASILANAPRKSKQWNDALAEFLRLFYGPLAMFEDFDHSQGSSRLTVEDAMIAFKHGLDNGASPNMLKNLSLALAHTCRESLGASWKIDLPQLHGDYQQKAIDYMKGRQKRMLRDNGR